VATGEVFPIINCVDLPATWRWYERTLGAEVAYRFPATGDPDFLTLRIGSGQIALARGAGPALYGEAPRPATGHAIDICVYVPDLDAVARRAPADVVLPPGDMPWGERVAYLRDPEGTMLLAILDEA